MLTQQSLAQFSWDYTRDSTNAKVGERGQSPTSSCSCPYPVRWPACDGAVLERRTCSRSKGQRRQERSVNISIATLMPPCFHMQNHDTADFLALLAHTNSASLLGDYPWVPREARVLKGHLHYCFPFSFSFHFVFVLSLHSS